MDRETACKAVEWTLGLMPSINQAQANELRRMFEYHSQEVVTRVIRRYVAERQKRPETLADLAPTLIDLGIVAALLRDESGAKATAAARREKNLQEYQAKQEAEFAEEARRQEEVMHMCADLSGLAPEEFAKLRSQTLESMPEFTRKRLARFVSLEEVLGNLFLAPAMWKRLKEQTVAV